MNESVSSLDLYLADRDTTLRVLCGVPKRAGRTRRAHGTQRAKAVFGPPPRASLFSYSFQITKDV